MELLDGLLILAGQEEGADSNTMQLHHSFILG
jgi:hypothetical protein